MPSALIDFTLGGENRGRFHGPTRLRMTGDELDRYCVTGYKTHLSREAAFDAAEVMMAKGKVDKGCHQTPAKCAECGHWHVHNQRIVFRDGGAA